MKNLCLLLFSILLLISCSNDDNEDNGVYYYLSSFRPSTTATEPISFEMSGISWKFDFEAQTIIVDNNDNDTILLEDGNYSYTLFDHECSFDDNQGMMVDDIYLGIFIRESNNGFNIIKLTTACLDGHEAIFTRPLII